MTREALKLLAVITVLAVQVCFASSSDESERCKKDLLLLVDTSFSIRKNFSEADVKPFLEKLVLDPLLNVREDGTQVALITFSQDSRAKIQLNFGKIYDAKQLVQFMKSLQWERVTGWVQQLKLARMGTALKLANKIFPGENPSNNRPDVDDVVVIMTDGRPRGRKNTPQMTKQNANELKEKGVLVVPAAVGPDRENFKHILQELATKICPQS